MQCPVCETHQAQADVSCKVCGSPAVQICVNCRHQNHPQAKYCSRCSTALRPQPSVGLFEGAADAPLAAVSPGERRLLTVMFCDLADSSAIAARLDVEDFRDILIDYHTRATEIITQCGGLVARYHGDGILSYFGYPTAGESDAEHAIDAALRLINAAGELGSASCQLHLRVGIASGLVIVGDLVRSDVADRPPVVGNTAHLAARLQSVAGPDAIIIASSTRRLAAGLFDYRPLGRQMLKGFDEPIWAWEVIGRKQIESRFRALHPEYSPLFGRKLEVDALVSHWTRAKAGDGQVVLLSGEP